MSLRAMAMGARTSKGRIASLLVLVALLAPGPLRAEPPDLTTETPAAMAALLIADGYNPGHAGTKALFTLVAGAEPRLGAWNFEGIFNDVDGRRLVGGASMFLGGFNGSPLGGGFSAMQLETALAVAGEKRNCWLLIDTDQVRPVPETVILQHGWNGKEFDVGDTSSQTLEAYAYRILVEMAFYTSQKAFDKAADRTVLYANLQQAPAANQGKVVFVEGRLKGLRRWDPAPLSRLAGVNDLYEGYIQTEDRETYCVITTVLPPGLKVKKKLDVPVTCAGYFFKKLRYEDDEGGKTKEHFVPLVIGHALELRPAPAAAKSADSGLDILLPVFVGVVALSVGLLVGLAYWFRRTDERLRKRLLRSMEKEQFVPPAPDAVPLAQPVVPPPQPGAEEPGKK